MDIPLSLSLACWGLLAFLLATLLGASTDASWRDRWLLAAPVAVLQLLTARAAFFPCRVFPMGRVGAARLVIVHSLGAALVGSLQSWAGDLWLSALDRLGWVREAPQTFAELSSFLFTESVLIYLLAVSLHYLVAAFGESREAKTRALKARLAAKESEIRALRAQLDPHFLFNSLNSIDALVSADPQRARKMCRHLSTFLRQSLEASRRENHTLSSELALIREYLAIEKIRFGDRLEFEVDDHTDGKALVPTLLLQPLVENAIVHGIAERLDGGTISLQARIKGGTVEIRLHNPVDPEPSSRRGPGVGLSIVERRLSLFGDPPGHLNTSLSEDGFVATVRLERLLEQPDADESADRR